MEQQQCKTPVKDLPEPGDAFAGWILRPDVIHLDHGSSGGCPRKIFDAALEWRYRLEAGSPNFYMRTYHPELRKAKDALARHINADRDGLVLMPGTTHALNVVMQSQTFEPGDELIITNHAYATVTELLEYIAARDGAKLVIVEVAYPTTSSDEIFDTIMAAVTAKTRFAVIDHIPSRTAIIFPIKRIVAALEAKGIDTLVDGAHAPGQIPLDLTDLNAPYYVASCHKWMCSPRGVGLLHVRHDRVSRVKPLIIARTTYPRDPSPYTHSVLEHSFDWLGTFDPSPFLCMPSVVAYLNTSVPAGDEARMQRNHDLALEARDVIFKECGLPHSCPSEMVGAMVSIVLPNDPAPYVPGFLSVQAILWDRYRVEVQAYYWPAYPSRLLRFSCQAHNCIDQYVYLAKALNEILDRERKGLDEGNVVKEGQQLV